MMKGIQRDQLVLNHQVTRNGLGALIDRDTLKSLHRRYVDWITPAWADTVAQQGNLNTLDPVSMELFSIWLVEKLPDAQVIDIVLPLLQQNPSFATSQSPEQAVAQWRGLQPSIRRHALHTARGPRVERLDYQTKMTPESIRAILQAHYGAQAIAALEEGGQLQLVANARSLPEDIQARYARDLQHVAAATTGNGDVFMLANRMTPQQVPGIFLHEVGEHASMATMLGADYGRLVSNFRRLLRRGDAYASYAASRVPNNTPAVHIASEQLAYLIEKVSNDQAAMPGGERGYELGQECMSRLRTWIFRSPLCQHLDAIGAAGDFTLTPTDLASLAREATGFAVRQHVPDAELQDDQINEWMDILDHTTLDQLYSASSEQRRSILSERAPEEVAGYLYALSHTNAPDMGPLYDDHTYLLAEMAAGKFGEHLEVIGAELLAQAQLVDARDKLSEHIDLHRMAMWRSHGDEAGSNRLHVLARDTETGKWVLKHYAQGIGIIHQETLESAELALSSMSPMAVPVEPNDYAVALETIRVTNKASTGSLQQMEATLDELATFNVQDDHHQFVNYEHRDTIIEALVSQSLVNPNINGAVLPTTDGTIAITKCAKSAGNWQVTYFDKDIQPTGDSGIQTLEDALRTFYSDAQPELLPGLLDQPGTDPSPDTAGSYDPVMRQRQHEATRTPAFRQWFGNSKLTDNAGMPLVVYHGTNAEFDEFRPSPFGALGAGIYLTGFNGEASQYGERVIDAHVALQNPVEGTFAEVRAMQLRGETSQQWTERMIRQGHDGIITRTVTGDVDYVVAFHPEQVKSASQNNGDFDPTNPSIRNRQVAVTQSPAFRQWFQQSLVVDVNAQPLVVYRGQHGDAEGALQAALPSYTFSSSPTVASAYATEPNNRTDIAQAPAVIPAYLSIQNPIVNDSLDPFVELSELIPKLGRDVVAYFARKHSGYFVETSAWADDFAEYDSVTQLLTDQPDALDKLYMMAYPLLDDPEFTQAAKDAGFDGAIHHGNAVSMDSTEYRVFEASQIKSSTGNNGDFDPNNDDTRYRSDATGQIESPAFQHWFGDSKMVDAEGKPMVVYHGAKDDFNIFEMGRPGLRSYGLFEVESSSPFAFFSESQPYAQEVAESKGGSTIVPVYLAAQTPLDLATKEGFLEFARIFNHDLSEFESVASEYSDYAQSKADYEDLLQSPDLASEVFRTGETRLENERYQMDSNWQDVVAAFDEDITELNVAWEYLDDSDAAEKLKAAGYDAVIFYESNGVKSFAVTDPEQIKSATHNNGDFDPDNADIRFREQGATPGESPAFRRWFGESQVTGEGGAPLRVYHGTHSFEGHTFQHSPSANPSSNVAGFYFASDAPTADGYAKDWRTDEYPEGAEVSAYYLSINKPYRIFTDRPNQAMLDKARELIEQNGLSNRHGYIDGKLDDFMSRTTIDASLFPRGPLDFQEVIKAGGYDGVRDGDHWVAFYPEQVKSATGNNGDFDPDNRDVLFAKVHDPAHFFMKSLWGTEAVALKQRIEELIPELQEAYVAGAANTDDLDAELEAASDRLEELLVAFEEDGPTLGDGGPLDNPRLHDGTDAEISYDVALAQIYYELYVSTASYLHFMEDEDKAEYLRNQVTDLADSFGGLAEGITDQDMLNACRDAYELRSQRSQRQQQAPGFGRSVQGFLADRNITPTEQGARFRANPVDESPAFKLWFGNSKAVTPDGQPMTLHHGTATQFAVFHQGRGHFYFTDDKPAAEAYSIAAGSDEPYVMDVYLSMQKPLVLDRAWFEENLTTEDGETDWGVLDTTLYEAERQGYDSAILQGFSDYSGTSDGYRQEREYDQYVVFRPEQIKSATHNNGDFDPTSPNIRFRADSKPVTELPAFKRWFGSSAVIDAQSKPLVVYHGTTQNITTFDTTGKFDEVGAFFTTNPASLDEYTAGESGNVVPVYLSIENPYEVTDLQWGWGEGLSPAEAKDQGYDGYIIKGMDGGDTYIAFSPDQIKSATANNGDFDPDNNDIRFTFAGTGSLSVNMEKLETALKMADQGGSYQRIYAETNWFRGVDGRWRYELSDHDARLHDGVRDAHAEMERIKDEITWETRAEFPFAIYRKDTPDHRGVAGRTKDEALFNLARNMVKTRLGRSHLFSLSEANPTTPYPLNEVLDHPELFEAYPHLASIKVFIDSSMEEGDRGSYFHSPTSPAIRVNANMDESQILSTLLHEAQHAIQFNEDFAIGGEADRSFTSSTINVLRFMVNDQKDQIDKWKNENQFTQDEIEKAEAMHRAALMFKSMENLKAYSLRERPSSVFRLIRSELEWIHDPFFRDNPLAKEIDRAFYAVPSRGAARNERIGQLAEAGARMLREAVGEQQIQLFEDDPRTTRSIVTALDREYQKQLAKLRPLQDMQARLADVDNLYATTIKRTPYEIYRALAGEIEARATQARQHLTAEERRERGPLRDYDVHASEAIVIFAGMELRAPVTMTGMADTVQPDPSYRQYTTPMDSLAFERWFGASQVTNGLGQPLMVQHRGASKPVSGDALTVLYPGGEPGVEEFPLSGTKLANRANELGLRSGPAIWFTDIEETPSTGRPIDEASTTYPAYLSLQNPLRITTHEQRRELIERYTPYPEMVSVPIDETGRRTKRVPFRTDFPYRFDGNQRKQLIRDGYDSIILDIPGAQREYIALKSTQIKSAIGNSGAFDAANPDIRFSKVDEAPSPHAKTAEFERWFRDSKVVDAEGKPLVVYHGTKASFTQFSTPSWFTPSHTFADLFSADWGPDEERSDDSRVMPVYLSITNPIRTDDWAVTEPDAAMLEQYKQWEAEGYDGIIFSREGETEYIAFRPDQIKSASANIGTFDASNPDIRFSLNEHSADAKPTFEWATHKPVSTEPGYQRAQALLPEVKTNLDVKWVDDEYGSWIDIQENDWHGSVNVGTVAHGVAFINGDLCELDSTAYFYRDTEPFWSPVVHADNEAVAKLYEALTGKRYPIFDVGTGEPEPYDRLIRLKEERGFLHNDGAFIHSSEYEKWINGPPEMLERESAAAFSEWFADSKIVDAEGNPLVLYHGTNADFTTFNPDASREGDQTLFATTKHSVASAFALYRSVWSGANVMPIYVKAERVLVVEGGHRPIREVEAAPGVDEMQPGESLRDYARRMSYDAICIRNTVDDVGPDLLPTSDVYILMPSAQIKSAIGNNGDFDPSNRDIRFRKNTTTTESPSFKRWFGESKVKGYDGKPLVVYHGTGSDITAFDNTKAPDGFDRNKNGVAWFSDAPEVAGTFAGYQDGETIAGTKLGNSNILPVYLSLQNPFIDNSGQYAKYGGLTRDEVADLEAEGYDGIIWPETYYDLPDTDSGIVRNQRGEIYGEDLPYPSQYAVFNSNQIKSAIGNNGDFDPDNSDIRFSAAAGSVLDNTETMPPATGSAAFRQWFRDSAVVDGNGEPIPVYHGTDTEFYAFKPSAFGTFGSGIYFTGKANEAEEAYGERVVDAYLSLQNPWIIDVDPDSPGAIAEDIDHPAVEAILALPNGRELIDYLRDNQVFYFDSNLQETLERLGYDGVIATYPGGSREYVAFHPGQVKSATHNNGDFDGQHPDIRYSFAGEQSQLAPRTRASLAKAMVEQGYSRDEVLKSTGWFTGDDGKWRYEIDDSKAILADAWYPLGEVNGLPVSRMDGSLGDHIVTLHPNMAKHLGKTEVLCNGLLAHPELLAAYPQLAEIRVRIDSSTGFTKPESGSFQGGTNTITIQVNPDLGGDPLSVLLHEVQHAIQRIEQFAPGGNPSMFVDSYELDPELAARFDTFQNIAINASLMEIPVSEYVRRGEVPEQIAQSVISLVERGEWDNCIEHARQTMITPFQKYMRLAGEIEARNVASRMNMSDDERQASSPDVTRDTPASESIILDRNTLKPALFYQAGASHQYTAAPQPGSAPLNPVHLHMAAPFIDRPDGRLISFGEIKRAVGAARTHESMLRLEDVIHNSSSWQLLTDQHPVSSIAHVISDYPELADELSLPASQLMGNAFIINALRSAGHDGAIYANENGEVTHQVFSTRAVMPASALSAADTYQTIMMSQFNRDMVSQFQSWSQGSHVATDDGAPLVVFAIEPMENDIQGSIFESGRGSKRFVSFAQAWDEAERSYQKGEAELDTPYQITPAYLAVKNPMPSIEQNGMIRAANLNSFIETEHVERIIDLIGVPQDMAATGTGLSTSTPAEMWIPAAQLLDRPEWVESIKRKGFDGALIPSMYEGSLTTEYRAFSPSQVVTGRSMPVMTTENTRQDTRLSSLSSPSLMQAMPVIDDEPDDTPVFRIQRGTQELKTSLRAKDIPCVVAPGSLSQASSRASSSARRVLDGLAEKEQLFVTRSHWVKSIEHTSPDIAAAHREALTQTRKTREFLNRWNTPSKHNCMQWDTPLSNGISKRVAQVLPQSVVAEGMTGKTAYMMALHILGSHQKATQAFDKAGIIGMSTGDSVLLWDARSEQLANMSAQSSNDARFHIAFHGSHSLFDQFNLDKVGTGEGAQVFGHGIYMADTLDVSRHYQKYRSELKVMYENDVYDTHQDMLDDLVPKVVAAHPEFDIVASDIHVRIGAAKPGEATGNKLEPVLQHLLAVSDYAPERFESVAEQYPAELVEPVRYILEGIQRPGYESNKNHRLMPPTGARGANEIDSSADRDYSMAMHALESKLHWHIRSNMTAEEMQSALDEYIAQSSDVETIEASIKSLKERLESASNEQDREFIESQLRDAEWNAVSAARICKLIDRYGPLHVMRPLQSGFIYAVDVDIEDNQYLMHDLPLAEQSELVQTAFRTLATSFPATDEHRQGLSEAISNNASGGDLLEALTGKNIFGNNDSESADASQLLLEQGVRGVKYLDGMSRRDRGDEFDTFNYVVFDPSHAKVLGCTAIEAREIQDILDFPVQTPEEKHPKMLQLG